MQKIVITGGLGYIGSELCKLYSGESRFKNITVIDKRFVSERVKQLRDWGIHYVNASILDKDAMRKHLSDADVVIHLAGITDVAYTKTQSNEEQDKEIRDTGILGTQNIIDVVGDNCKIIFPSTHVVYEGSPTTQLDITEEVPVCPELTYSKGKAQSEQDLINSAKNYIILRLASVYGYSTDTMRIGIMPNLFSKIASQKGTIKLFSGGVQMKSLVPLVDVARCMKFMAENSISKEIFHLSKESMSVKDVALLCKKIDPSVDISETQDEIPNLGYTLSNKKLLSTGFEFRHDIETCLAEMIHNWSYRESCPELEYIDKGGDSYSDKRGIINNYKLTEPINLIGYIESFAGTVRANHYHPIQEQKCLLVKGQYISVIKDLSEPNAITETKIINEGDIAIIKPNVAHTMVFTMDSTFLNLVRGEREHKNYGITHTIPYELVNEETRVNLLNSAKTECRVCYSKQMERVISLGNSPLANSLKNNKDDISEMYPLEMNYCSKCHNCQLSMVVPPEKMFNNYLYTSSTTSSFRKHFEDAAEYYIKRFNLCAGENFYPTTGDLVVDIGSNDGIFLEPLQKRGIRVCGVEPASNLALIAQDKGLPTINKYFNDECVASISKNYGKASIVTASNVFAHNDKLEEIAKNVQKILKDDGTFIVEVQYLLDTINDLTFDNIYHEHVNYWSVISIRKFLNQLGFFVYDVEHINTHGGSIRVFATLDKNMKESPSVQEFVIKEINYGLAELKTYKKFGKDIQNIRNIVRTNAQNLKKRYKNIAAYGSPAKATTALNYFGIDNSIIDYTVEDNSLKNGKFIPGVNIPIVNKQYLNNNLPDVIIVLAWNFFEQIKENNKEIISKGVRFISIKDLQNPDFSIG